MSEKELKPKLSPEEEAKNARDLKIARENKRQADYGYKDNFTKYVNPEYYKRMGAIARRQQVGLEDRLKNKVYMESAAQGVMNSWEKAAYNKNQKSEIKSLSSNSLRNDISSQSKIESGSDQRAAKALLDLAKKTNPALNMASKIPGVGGLMEDAAAQAVNIAKEKIKKRIKMQIIAWTAGCLLNPVTWIIVASVILLCILIGSFV